MSDERGSPETSSLNHPEGPAVSSTDTLDHDVRLYVFRSAADTAHVPQAAEIAGALALPQTAVEDSLRRLAASRVLILAPGAATIWTANPFSAVPTAFRVHSVNRSRSYWGVCIWDALGVLAALGEDGSVTTTCGCGECGVPLCLEVRGGELIAPLTTPAGPGGLSADDKPTVHFGVPALRWWENIVFT